MTKLSDTQSIILSAAAQRADGNVLPLPGSLRGGAASKVVAALLSRGLIREEITDSPRKADAAMNRVWRNLPEPDSRGVLLFMTAAGADAIGIELPVTPDEPQAATAPVEPGAVPYAFNEGTNSAGEPAAGAPTGADEAPVEATLKRRGRLKTTAPTGADVAPAPKTRGGTKQAQLIAMLRRKEGATIAQIVEALAWAPHTIRGAFAGALKKKLGLTVTSEKVEGTRVYRISDDPATQEAGL
ncbi:DUF3489 domain-containing protein [Amaricoccus sp.]|uniref:DUF3489 domain-containing protein n=1 Tax=Amaricoccus sp. TaxID=1872485 RepID=UPI001B410A74|nr:DUF3489 domain-containing protein [Amaricoccus sp.]MBP7003538.1 DUF3489 domain-containing protein [Amaricoccus sp.]